MVPNFLSELARGAISTPVRKLPATLRIRFYLTMHDMLVEKVPSRFLVKYENELWMLSPQTNFSLSFSPTSVNSLYKLPF